MRCSISRGSGHWSITDGIATGVINADYFVVGLKSRFGCRIQGCEFSETEPYNGARGPNGTEIGERMRCFFLTAER